MAKPLLTCPSAGARRAGVSPWARQPGPTPFVELPATHLTPSTARVMTPLPYGETCNVHLAGAPLYEVWYRLNAVAGQFQLGFQASPEALSSYLPVVTIYTGTPTALTPYRYASGAEGALQIPVTPGESYFFRVRHSGVAIGTGIVMLTISTRLGLNVYVPNTGLLINDDVSGNPLIAISGTGDGVLQSRPFPSGERACMLPSGISLWEDKEDSDHLYLYDATLTLIASPEWVRHGTDHPPIASNGVDTFYVGDSQGTGGAHIRTVSDVGVMGPTTWVLPPADTTIRELSVSADETIAYYRNAVLGDGPIKRYDLVTHSALPDLAAHIPGTNQRGELLTFSDGSTLVGYTASPTDYVKRYAADGSVLATYPMPGSDMIINRLSRALTEASFWVWLYGIGDAEGTDTFVQIQVSDGAYLEEFTSPQYSAGVFMGPIESTEVPFGHPISCPFTVPPPPGLPPYGPPPTLEPPYVTPATETDQRYIRRLRRAPHVTSENTRLFVRKFELDLERGQGLATGQGSDPIVMLRLSRDGGQTWGEEVRLHAGALGAYTQRVIARRLGHARDTVFEVTVSDPIAWSLVGAWLDLEGGTS